MKGNYLENPICTLVPLWDFNPKIKENIICTVFFRMKEHYKNVLKYINGLKKWCEFMNELKEDYKFRIFIDKNVLEDPEIMEIIKSCKKMQPVLFTCADYMVDNYHVDLFGTLIRYLPMFDFPNNDAKTVFVVDVDFGSSNDLKIQRFPTFINYNKIHNIPILAGHTTMMYDQFYKQIQLSHVVSGAITFKKKYDKNLLLDFIKKAHEIKDVGAYNKRFTDFGFGVDELFLNKYLLNKITVDVEKKIGLLYYYNPGGFIWSIFDSSYIINDTKTYTILRKIMGKFYKRNMPLEDMKKELDIAFYDVYKLTYKNNYYGKRIYETFQYLIDNKIEWVKLDLLKFVMKNFKGILYAICIAKINVPKLKIEDVYVEPKILLD